MKTGNSLDHQEQFRHRQAGIKLYFYYSLNGCQAFSLLPRNTKSPADFGETL
ncbi:hypothetical protein [Paenibacillus ihuae]|uniref:hypothetical protein n=1 Tax=Paenibacillus ihuae TaxID=1232431 RepID=UPI001ADFD03F|nr:hypothetical protein [Paenibacillus ihuae]